jgi:predicted MFS family arabinose efflux permease
MGIIILFLLMGIVSGGFASRLPAVKSGLHLSAGTLGLVLLGPAIGLVLSTPVTGVVLQHLAPRRWITVGLVPFCVMLPLAALTHRPFMFFGALLGWGLGLGCVDVSLSTEATRVEASIGRRIMSGLHGCYSVGALAGAGIGALAALVGLTPKIQWAILGVIALAVGLYATTLLPRRVMARSDAGESSLAESSLAESSLAESSLAGESSLADESSLAGEAPFAGESSVEVAGSGAGGGGPGLTLSGPLIALAFISFASLLSEGAASDWSAVYLHTSLGATPALATLAYAGFQAAMVTGRLTGDRLTMRLGPVRLVRVVAVLGALGLGTGLAVGNPVVAIAGFTLLGIGLAVSFPLAITRASALGRAGPAVAIVTSCGYLGMLTGPAIIGGLASIISLPVALGLVAALCALLAVLAGSLSPDSRRERSASIPLELLDAVGEASG